MSAKTILVTGASGFIGQQVLGPLLKRGYNIHAVSNKSQPAQKNILWHRANLLDAKEREQLLDKVKPDTLLHLAWYVEHGKFWNAPENADWQEASIDLFRHAESAGVKRLVGIGTCAEYDWQRVDQTPWKETDPCRPHTPYGKAKLAVFEALKAINTNYAWGRIFHLFGKGEHPNRLISSIIHSLKNNQEAKCSSGKQIQDFMAVQDIGEAIAALADSPVTGSVNIASGIPMSVSEIALLIGKQMRKENLIKLGALPDRPDTPPYIVADISRLQNEVGFTPSTSLENRIAELIRQF